MAPARLLRLTPAEAHTVGYLCTTEGCTAGDCANCLVVARLLHEARQVAEAPSPDRSIVAFAAERWRSRRNLGQHLLILISECTPLRLAQACGLPVGTVLGGLVGNNPLSAHEAGLIADELHTHASDLLQASVDLRATFTPAVRRIA